MINKNTLDKNRTIFLIDGSSLLYRAYYGTHPLHTSTGISVQAVYSFCRMIKRLVKLFDPEYMILVWDSKGKTVRSEMYPAYKATRQAPPSDLFMQKEYCMEFAELIGLKQLAQEGVEADDLLFSLVRELVGLDNKDIGDKLVLVTSDKDMGQLIADNVLVYDPTKEILFDVDNFTEKLGFPIAKLPFYFALLGDASDNIPGVHGVGKKTALELVNQFDSLEDLYAKLDIISSKRARVALESQKDNAFLSRDLFLLRYYKTDIKKGDIVFDKNNWQQAEPLFKKLEFKSLLKDLAQEQNQAKDFAYSQNRAKQEQKYVGDVKEVSNIENFEDQEGLGVESARSLKSQESLEDLKSQERSKDLENQDNQDSSKNLGHQKNLKSQEGLDSLESFQLLKKWDFKLVSTEQELIELCKLLKNSAGFAFDTETTGLQALEVDLVGISFSVKEGQAFYIPVGYVLNNQEQIKQVSVDTDHSQQQLSQKLTQQLSIYGTNNQEFSSTSIPAPIDIVNDQKLSRQLSIDRVNNQGLDNKKLENQELSQNLLAHKKLVIDTIISYLKPVFADTAIEKYAHNSKYDKLVLSRYGIEVCGPLFDTYIAASLVTKSWQSAGLKKLSMHYFNEPMLSYDQIMSTGSYKNFSEVPLGLALLYAASDAHQTFRLVSVLRQELENQQLMSLFLTIETPLIQILYEMESTGIILDAHELEKVNQVVTHDLEELKKTLFAITGEPINLNSSKQVAQLLFVTLGLPPSKKMSKSGGYSTDSEVLAALARDHVVPALLLKYRELTKLKSTYLDALPTYINKKTGRIHTSFSQARVATGRLSSADPNMQNIPNNGYGIAIRGAFRPPEQNVFVSADYSQIELRVLAHLSQDPLLVQAFKAGQDIHVQTAARLFDVALEQVTHEQRQMGKRINFSILYGLTPYGLSKDLGIPLKEAKQFIAKYFAQYAGVQVWMDSIIEFAKEHGYVETFWGRRRDIPGIYEKNNTLYQEAKRIAVNTVAQGTAAEIMKQGMIKVRNAFLKQKLDARLVLQIHDELLVSARTDQAKEVEACIARELESVVSWSIPFLVSTRIGADWRAVSK